MKVIKQINLLSICSILVGCFEGESLSGSLFWSQGQIGRNNKELSNLSNAPTLPLNVIASIDAPISELSGLALVETDLEGAQTFAALGDHSSELFKITLRGISEPPVTSLVELSNLFSSEQETEQWEGIAADSSGQILILQEYPPTVYVISKDLTKLVKRIQLDGILPPDADTNTDTKKNSLGEGMILLPNRHLLIAKEKNSPQVMEFGPVTAVPAGFDSQVATTEAFSGDGETIIYTALKTWELNAAAKELLKDISDMSRAPDGSLYLISHESRIIARIEGKLKVDENKVKIKQVWNLPETITNPEGLAFSNLGTLIGSDGDQFKNIVVIDLLP